MLSQREPVKSADSASEDAQACFDDGLTALSSSDFPAAMAAFRRAIKARGDHWPGWFNLLVLLEKLGHLEEMDEGLSILEKVGVKDTAVPVLRAAWHLRVGNLEQARILLVATDTKGNQATGLMHSALLGQVLDRLGDVDGAFEAFTRMNLAEAARPYARAFDKQVYLDRLQYLTEYFTAENDPLTPENDDASPVFIIGFPRSGTTLLGAMLNSHETMGVLQEVPLVDELLDREGRETLYDRLTTGQRQSLRQQYLREVQSHSNDPAKSRWIDKLPLNIGEAGFINRLFPKAKFILSLRHPCDCVLSCFMQQFEINHAMANFVSLTDAARLYDRVMTLWNKYTDVLPLQVHTVKYEDLVTSPESVLRSLLEFLEVPWSDTVLDYQSTAKASLDISTPGCDQVTGDIYTTTIGRWEKYHEHMQGVLPTLNPWIGYFGYGET